MLFIFPTNDNDRKISAQKLWYFQNSLNHQNSLFLFHAMLNQFVDLSHMDVQETIGNAIYQRAHEIFFNSKFIFFTIFTFVYKRTDNNMYLRQ